MISSKEQTAPLQPLSTTDKWIDNLNIEAFRQEIYNLGQELLKNQGPNDLAHLHKMIWWSDSLTFFGLILTPFLPVWSLLPAVLLAFGVTSRWTMIAHHTCHGGYDKSGDTRFNRFRFGVGSIWRRVLDWCDWMLPEAWNVEHNQLHHYKLGEDTDPDLVERNMTALRAPGSLLTKYLSVAFIISTWKWWYYAPNTYQCLRMVETRRTNPTLLQKEKKRLGADGLKQPLVFTTLITEAVSGCFSKSYQKTSLLPKFVSLSGFMGRVMLPFVLYRFIVLPMLPIAIAYGFGLIHKSNLVSAFLTSIGHFVLADLIANIHSFVIIGTNHCGNDLYRFDTPCTFGSGTFYLRQIISSTNFTAGTDLIGKIKVIHTF